MWELIESSSSPSGSSSSVVESQWTLTVLTVALRKFNGDEEEPLIKFEDDSEDKGAMTCEGDEEMLEKRAMACEGDEETLKRRQRK
ncbi:hypothetical protein FNV43_RR20504 [Rhamnella rubrinervis]|uniref:Uncharacterized protein n=1 Tax=Rhamnella rubrinervis TaxID=2594499 RepID=A0A8K0E0H7_9ROSA|nr:hypothetical protein FNV43_RR20504 [Rhamnella rubrinervis]